MGAFLHKPVTDKDSGDDENEKLKCGYSSMQGWRIHQEDAYNCILNFDNDTSLFAVYDGHGGCEVAEYCSLHLPNFLKNLDLYKNGDIEKALIEGFLEFDRTICTPEVIAELKKLVDSPQAEGEEESEVEENVDNLYAEATMPIEQVIEKYKKCKKDGDGDQPEGAEEEHKSKKQKIESSNCEAACSSSSSAAATSSKKLEDSEPEVAGKVKEDNETDGVSSSTSWDKGDKDNASSAASVKDNKTDSLPDSSTQNGVMSEEEKLSESKKEEDKAEPEENEEKPKSEIQQENSAVPGKGKGKAIVKKVEKVIEEKIKRRIKSLKTPNELYQKLIQFAEEDSESEDSEEEDETFKSPNRYEESSDDNEEPTNPHLKESGSEEESAGEESEEEGEEVEDEEEDEIDDTEFDFGLKEPGYNSGSTAVLALLKGNELFVANVGDSRCLVCREGKAVEMSEDHKPEDTIELNRIKKAGGNVYDERINGGLNLSRAFGDFSYKQNKELNDKEQMVIALPDIRKLTIDPSKDEFMVLACDGIWNCKSNQEVVDFLRPKVLACDSNDKLSKIAEELLDQCLGGVRYLHDGNDNMTLIIVKFKLNKSSNKRSSSPLVGSPKRKKTEDSSECSTTTASS